MEEWYSDGQIRHRGTYKGSVSDGWVEKWYPNGQIEIRGLYKNGMGWEEAFYENGQLKMKKSFEGVSCEGLFEWYGENGRLERSGIYRHGRRIEGEDAEAYSREWEAKKEKIVAEMKRQAEEKQKREAEEKRHAEEIQKAMKRGEAIGNLKGRLEMISDPAFRKPIGKARTPERQAKAEEITEVRRARSLLSRAAKKAHANGDMVLFKAIEDMAWPYALHNRKIELEFKKKRIERRTARAKKDRE